MSNRKLPCPHPDNLTLDAAKNLQQELRKKVLLRDQFTEIKTVAGADLGYTKGTNRCRAAVVVLSYPTLKHHESSVLDSLCPFPYIPGYLSFREIPALLLAMEKLSTLPDIILCDGQGIAHPRRLGLASHLGVLTGIPTIGVAKSRLIGSHSTLGDEKGEWCWLKDKGERIGMVYRSRTGVKPIYISPGHKVSFGSARQIVMQCLTRYRLPETTRMAHHLASSLD
ncbi:deoxyribonuclease V [Candidatus Riflebacteria bacterium]